RVQGTAMLWGAVIAEVAVILCARYTDLAWLWWNVVGCVVGVGAAVAIQLAMGNGATGSQPVERGTAG
ncbi:MAG: hypothetical protein ACLGH0_06115, partial [Thermoanaerobaculia bacterium]